MIESIIVPTVPGLRLTNFGRLWGINLLIQVTCQYFWVSIIQLKSCIALARSLTWKTPVEKFYARCMVHDDFREWDNQSTLSKQAKLVVIWVFVKDGRGYDRSFMKKRYPERASQEAGGGNRIVDCGGTTDDNEWYWCEAYDFDRWHVTMFMIHTGLVTCVIGIGCRTQP